jgi:hypothetical protein
MGAIRSLWHSRQPFEVCGARVYPEMLGLPKADEAFNADGSLKDAKMGERLKTLVSSYLGFAQALSSGHA